MCNVFDEHIDHIISGCPTLAPAEYTRRHDNTGRYIHWKLCQANNLPNIPDKWYNHHPDPVVGNDQVTIMWDTQVHTDRVIKANILTPGSKD